MDDWNCWVSLGQEALLVPGFAKFERDFGSAQIERNWPAGRKTNAIHMALEDAASCYPKRSNEELPQPSFKSMQRDVRRQYYETSTSDDHIGLGCRQRYGPRQNTAPPVLWFCCRQRRRPRQNTAPPVWATKRPKRSLLTLSKHIRALLSAGSLTLAFLPAKRLLKNEGAHSQRMSTGKALTKRVAGAAGRERPTTILKSREKRTVVGQENCDCVLP